MFCNPLTIPESVERNRCESDIKPQYCQTQRKSHHSSGQNLLFELAVFEIPQILSNTEEERWLVHRICHLLPFYQSADLKLYHIGLLCCCYFLCNAFSHDGLGYWRSKSDLERQSNRHPYYCHLYYHYPHKHRLSSS